MKKIVARISLNLVLILIGFHTFIPHPHSDELTEQEHRKLHQNAQSVFGFLRYVFHENDDESLDNIIFATYGKINYSPVKCKYPRALFVKTTGTSTYFVHNLLYQKTSSVFYKNITMYQNGMRAPPYISLS